jgi:hypothetical protein
MGRPDSDWFPEPTTAERASRTRTARPGKRLERAQIAGAHKVARERTSVTSASAALADRSASARSSTVQGHWRATVKAAAQATLTSAARADRAASKRVTRGARSATRKRRKESMAGTHEHSSQYHKRIGGENVRKKSARARGRGREVALRAEREGPARPIRRSRRGRGGPWRFDRGTRAAGMWA